MSETSATPTVIVGAGPAGVSAALTLARAGVSVVIVERSDAFGGKVRTVADVERRYEHGMHGWWPCYVNFDRMLRWAGVEPAAVLHPATDLRILIEDGRQTAVAPLRRYLPSPLFLFAQALKTPVLNVRDILHLGRFFVHLLAFDPVRDEARYASWSFEQFLDYVGVTPRTKEIFFEAWVKAFCYSRREDISAAVALSSFKCYVVPSDRGSIPRWLGGFSDDLIFRALEGKLRELGVTILTSTSVTGIARSDTGHLSVTLGRAPAVAVGTSLATVALGPRILGSVDATAITGGGASLVVGGEPLRLRPASGGSYEAISRRCSHAGCETNWSTAAQCFECPCHGGVFDAAGVPIAGPPGRPLERFTTAVSGSRIDISRVSGGAALNADAVIVATDVAGALEIVSNTPAVPTDARHSIGHLETTSVIVIRFWFDAETPLADKPQSALTPLLPMIDAYFCLSKIVRDEAAGEHIVEVQLAAAKDHYLELADASLVALALDDLHVVSADYRADRLRASRVQRHINVFTAFRPGLEALGLGAQVAEGVYVAGDWAPRPGNSWMMERAVATGVARAADVLAAQGIDVPAEVAQPARAGWLLRFASMLAFLWRSIVRRGFTVPDPMTEKQMIEHDRVDHVINGWACIVVGFCALLPLFDPEFSPLQKVWPGVFVLVNLYFFFHVEPWVRLQYGSWLRSLGDKHSFGHRLMTAGGVAAGAIELGLAFGYLRHEAWRAFFPAGSIAFGVLFALHHWGEDPLADRQHRDIGFLAVFGGVCLGMARFFGSMHGLVYAWPILVLCQAFLFVTYMATTLHGGHVVAGAPGADDHSHTH